MKKVYFWQLLDWGGLIKGFLLVDMITAGVLFFYFIPKIIHEAQGIGMTKTTPAQIINITTKEHIREGRSGNFRSIDFYYVEYSYYVGEMQHKGIDIIPNSPLLGTFVFKLLHTQDTIFVSYNPSQPDKSQLKTEK